MVDWFPLDPTIEEMVYSAWARLKSWIRSAKTKRKYLAWDNGNDIWVKRKNLETAYSGLEGPHIDLIGLERWHNNPPRPSN